MFDGLKKWLEETAADVNPWDNGKTGASIRAGRPKAPPAQTIANNNRPQQRQSQVGQFGIDQRNATNNALRTPTFRVDTQTPKLPSMNQKPKQPGFDPIKAVGDVGKGIAQSIGDSVNTVGNAYASGIKHISDEVSGENDRRQQAVLDNMKTSLEARRKSTMPGPLSNDYRQRMQRTAQGSMNTANDLRQQQQSRIEDIRSTNDPLKVAGAGVNLLGTVAAPGAGKIASGVTKAISPVIRTPIAKVAGAVAEGAVQGAGFGAATQLQKTGSQTNAGQLRDATLQGAGAGAAFGGAVPVAGAVVKRGVNAGRALNTRLNDIKMQPGYTPEYGGIKVPGVATGNPQNARLNDAYETAGQTTPGKVAVQSNILERPRQFQKSANPNIQESSNHSALQQGLGSPLLDKTAQIDRTYPNSTPDIDTKQYVSELNKMQKDAQKGSSGVREKTSDFKEKFIDDLAPIEDRLNNAIKSGAKIDPKDHITYQLDRSRRAEGVMNAYVRDNGLDKVIQNVPDTNEFDQYLIARHAKELDKSITTGRDAIKDAALVQQLEGKYAGAAQEVYRYNQKLLDTSVEYGLIDSATAQKLKQQYPEYVPLNRIFNEDELTSLHGGAGSGSASISKQSAVQKLKGSNREIASPLNSIIDKTRIVVEQGERNKAAQMLANYRDLPGNPFNLKEIPANETIGSRHTISYLDNGKKRTFEVDKEIADAAKNMTRQEIGLWGQIAAVPARVLRGGATTVNIGFAGANVVKDVIGAAINSSHPFRIADPRNFGKALAASLNHNGKYYQELMREGVSGTSFDMYRNPLKTNIGEIRSHKNIGTRAAYNVTHPSQWYRTLENTIGRSEDFGRALQYYSNKSGFKAGGKTDLDATILAANQARQNSTNFYRHGSVGKGINLAIPYWNAGVQGARIGVNRIKERPAQTLAKIGFVIAAPSAMIAVNNYSSETNRQVMESIPDYEKDSNIIIVGPNAKLNQETGRWEDVHKIPVPPQHIGVHKTIQDGVRSAYTGKQFDTLGNLGRVVEDYSTINPTSLKDTANRYIPQGLKLAAEPMTNTNFYTGNKIVPDSQKNLPAADQYGDYTSGTAKTIGKLTNTSPRVIDNTIKTGMGGAGQNLVNAADSVLAATGVIGKDEVRGTNVIDSVTKRFSGANSISPSDKADTQFNKLKAEVTKSEAYKNASQYDKGRMLNRLEGDLNAVAYNADGKSDKKLTTKQKELASGGFKLDTYTKLDVQDGGEYSKDLPSSINSIAKSVLKNADTSDRTDDWKKQTTNNKDVARKLSEWLPNKVDLPGVSNEVALEWAKFKKDEAAGKVGKLEAEDKKKAILRDAFNSTLSGDEKKLYGLSKARLQSALDNGIINDDNIKKALDVEKKMYDAGLLDKQTLAQKLGLASSDKGSGGKKGGKGGKKSAKGKFDYKLFGFTGSGQSNSKQLYDLLKTATLKQKTKKT